LPAQRVINENGAGAAFYEECYDFLKLEKAKGTAIDWLRVGSILEDRLDPCTRNCRHFYTPGGPEYGYVPFLCGNEADGLTHAKDLWAEAIDELAFGLKEGNADSLMNAFIAVGSVVHLVHDLSAPDHTRDDLHACTEGNSCSFYRFFSRICGWKDAGASPQTPGFFEAWLRCPKGETRRPVLRDGKRGRAPSAHRRLGYPLPGCVPAEPGSVSPSAKRIVRGSPRWTRVINLRTGSRVTRVGS